MPTSIATVQINAPVADVYRYVSTPHLLSEWVGGLSSDTRVGGDGEVKVGMWSPDHRQIPGTRSEGDPEINVFSPDQSVTMRIESAGFIMLTRFHLFESDGVTTVRQSVKLSYKRWFKMFAMITNRSVQQRTESNLLRLKRRVERDVHEGDAASAA